jgi:hypothetical protein
VRFSISLLRQERFIFESPLADSNYLNILTRMLISPLSTSISTHATPLCLSSILFCGRTRQHTLTYN